MKFKSLYVSILLQSFCIMTCDTSRKSIWPTVDVDKLRLNLSERRLAFMRDRRWSETVQTSSKYGHLQDDFESQEMESVDTAAGLPDSCSSTPEKSFFNYDWSLLRLANSRGGLINQEREGRICYEGICNRTLRILADENTLITDFFKEAIKIYELYVEHLEQLKSVCKVIERNKNEVFSITDVRTGSLKMRGFHEKLENVLAVELKACRYPYMVWLASVYVCSVHPVYAQRVADKLDDEV